MTPLTPSELAAKLGKRAETVRRWCAAGKLACTQTPTGQYLIDPAAAAKLLPGQPAGETRDERRKRGQAALDELRRM